jgi:hypothetical protein
VSLNAPNIKRTQTVQKSIQKDSAPALSGLSQFQSISYTRSPSACLKCCKIYSHRKGRAIWGCGDPCDGPGDLEAPTAEGSLGLGHFSIV